jgi:hypothetical protein
MDCPVTTTVVKLKYMKIVMSRTPSRVIPKLVIGARFLFVDTAFTKLLGT